MFLVTQVRTLIQSLNRLDSEAEHRQRDTSYLIWSTKSEGINLDSFEVKRGKRQDNSLHGTDSFGS